MGLSVDRSVDRSGLVGGSISRLGLCLNGSSVRAGHQDFVNHRKRIFGVSGPCSCLVVGAHRRFVRVDQHDSSGKSALHLCAWRGSLKSLGVLLDLGADVNRYATGAHCYGKTPLFFAITRCREDVAAMLLSHGATARIVNNKGQSPLSLAQSHFGSAAVESLAAISGAILI